MKKIAIFILMMSNYVAYSIEIDSTRQSYEDTFQEIVEMLQKKQPYSFKKAVFAVENCYLDNAMDFQEWNNDILNLKDYCMGFIKSNQDKFLYEGEDRAVIMKYAAVFKVMTDSIVLVKISDDKNVYLTPYIYDFEDVWGNHDWTQMFVSKLMATHKGNCHALPYLYKIVCEELGVKAHLALAPNHMYIKHKSKKTGMYNTELTSAAFPIDAWLMASGYIHIDAIKSGIYMDTLSNNQSLALCLVDLAKGYEKKFADNDGAFILKCCDMALKYYPNCINALLLKSETLKRQFDRIMITEKVKIPSDIFHIQEAKNLFDNYEKLTVQIHKLGYRKMPERMYLDWLLLLKENRDKYQNKSVNSEFKP